MIRNAADLPPCDFYHVSDHPHGWEHYGMTYQPHEARLIEITHVVPCNDTRLHKLCHTCWCEPTIDPDDGFLLVHNSADNRELYERGLARPS